MSAQFQSQIHQFSGMRTHLDQLYNKPTIIQLQNQKNAGKQKIDKNNKMNMNFPYHLTGDNENRVIQPFANQYDCCENRMKLQQLNPQKMQKIDQQKSQAIYKVEKDFQQKINGKFPSTCCYVSCMLGTICLCYIPFLFYVKDQAQKFEDMVKEFLIESNQYLKQFGVQVFRRSSIQGGGRRNQRFDWLVYTLNEEEVEKMKNEVYYSQQPKNLQICCCTVQQHYYIDNENYQGPQLNIPPNQPQNQNNQYQQNGNFMNGGNNNNFNQNQNYQNGQNYPTMESSLYYGQPLQGQNQPQMKADPNLIQ
ncbi:hypothetical protein PPERSA_13110 [Pseudocohnilembus persalinus]|uniref:Uncharacterized protein n=1 Tax=Pseudocohnilembus persalinus TaxID=266149 RepID=A0A0V0QWK7_PSEPJ|nr:hypothetical protein PPERSA_13110 [Pseudocohnilembus persalinus]|eukprot:KRX06631.1 hypothetical protein PPERSA_13110 [Pseudocohnilembus persalinus]